MEIGGATAVGGSVGPAETLFGTIAWLPGSRTAYGVAVDAQTQDEADFAAMTACTQLNHGNAGCKPAVRMFGTDKKCGAIATDERKTAIAFGPGRELDDSERVGRSRQRRRYRRGQQHRGEQVQFALTGA